MTKNYYEILEVSYNASIERIKVAYHSLAKKYHADNGNVDSDRMAEINEAYEVLSNEHKKAEYDRMLKGGNSTYSTRNTSANNGSPIKVRLFSQDIEFSQELIRTYQFHKKFVKEMVRPLVDKYKSLFEKEVERCENVVEFLIGWEDYYSDLKNEVQNSFEEYAQRLQMSREQIVKCHMSVEWNEIKTQYVELIAVFREELSNRRWELFMKRREVKPAETLINQFDIFFSLHISAVFCFYEGMVADWMESTSGIVMSDISSVLTDCASSIEILTKLEEEEDLLNAFECDPYNSLVYSAMLLGYPSECPALYRFAKDTGSTDFPVFEMLEVFYSPSDEYRTLRTDLEQKYDCNFNEAVHMWIVEQVILCAGTMDAKKIDEGKLTKAKEIIRYYSEQYEISEKEIYDELPFLIIAQEYIEKREALARRIQNMKGESLNVVLSLIETEKSSNDEHIWGIYEQEFKRIINDAALSEIDEKYSKINAENIEELQAFRQNLQTDYSAYEASEYFYNMVIKSILQLQEDKMLQIMSGMNEKTPAEVIDLLKELKDEMESVIYEKYVGKIQGILEEKIEAEINTIYEKTDKSSIPDLQETLNTICEQYKEYHCTQKYVRMIETRIFEIKEEQIKREIEVLPSKELKEIEVFLCELKNMESVLVERYQPQCEQILRNKQKELLYSEIGKDINDSMTTNGAMDLFNRIQNTNYPEAIKEEAFLDVRNQLLKNNMDGIEGILANVKERFSFINSENSKVIIYNSKQTDKVVNGLMNLGVRLEFPIVSHLKEGLLDLSTHINGFSITQKSLLYYEKGILNRIPLADISEFALQKKFMGTDMFVTTVSGMSIKLASKFPKEIINEVPNLLKETVNQIVSSNIYSN